jgi:hypothetical protein
VDPEICAYRRDFFIRPLIHLRERRHWGDLRLFISLTALVFLLKAGLSALHGDLVSDSLLSDLRRDLDAFLPFELPLRASEVLSNRTYHAPAGPSSTQLPFLRDYADMLMTLLAVSHIVLLTRQWPRISRTIDELRRTGVLVLDDAAYSQMATKHDQRFNSLLSHAVSALLASLTITLILLAFFANGMFHDISLNGSSPSWERDLFQSWWAGPSNPVAFAVNVLLYTIFFYVMGRHIAIGLVAMWAIKDVVTEGEVRLTVNHPDGVGGLQTFRDVFVDILMSVLLSAGFISVGFLYLPGEGWTYAAGLGMVLFVAVNPLFILFPIALSHREMDEAKTRILTELHQRLTFEVGGGLDDGRIDPPDPARAHLLLEFYRDAQRLPTYPLSLGSASIYMAGYVGPATLLLFALIRFATQRG